MNGGFLPAVLVDYFGQVKETATAARMAAVWGDSA